MATPPRPLAFGVKTAISASSENNKQLWALGSDDASLNGYHFLCSNAFQNLCFDAVFAKNNARRDDPKQSHELIEGIREFAIVLGRG